MQMLDKQLYYIIYGVVLRGKESMFLFRIDAIFT